MGALFGRARELAILDAVLTALDGGPARAVLLRGEAGVGKTRLAEAAAERARARGAKVAWTACWPGDEAPDLWPWAEVLAQLGSALPQASAALAPDALAFEQTASAMSALRDVVARGPTLVVIDDVQWADHASLRVLTMLLRARLAAPLVVVLTERPENEARVASIAQATRGAEPIEVGGLDDAALAEWLEGVQADPAAAARLRARTGGNPLFVSHVLAQPPARTDAVPSGVRALIESAIAGLDASAQSVVSYAALSARPLPVAVLAAVLGETGLAAPIARAARAGVLQQSAGPVRFAHELAREVAGERLGEAHRAALHLELAAALERLRRSGSLEIRASDVAHHFVAALPHGDARAARDAAIAAADEAERERAMERAADWLERAAAVPTSEATDALRLLVRASIARAHADQGARGRDLADGVCERAAAIGARDVLASAALAMGTEIRFGVVDPRLVARLEQAASLDGLDPDLRATVLARLASARQPSRTPEREHEVARQAIALARRTGDERTLAGVLDLARPAFRTVDDLDERRAIDEETLALAGRLGDRALRLRALQRLSAVALERGALAEGEAMLGELDVEARAVGDRTMRTHAAIGGVTCALWRADWSEAEQRLEAHARAMQGLPTPGAFVLAPAEVARVATWRARGRTAEPDPAWLSAFSDETAPGPSAMMRLFLASTQARLGARDDGVRALLERMLASGIEERMPFIGLVLVPDLVARHELAETGARLAAKWASIRGRFRVTASLASFDGAADRALGQLLGAAGDRDAAIAHFESGIALEERCGAHAQAALTRLALGELGGTGARAALEEAMRTFERLGMEALAARARALARGAPLSLPGSSGPKDVSVTRDGDTWIVRGGGEEARLKGSHGLRYLAHLVERPGDDVHVLELVALVYGEDEGRAKKRGREARMPMLDARAKQAYRARIDVLRAGIADAEERGDADGVERKRAELDAIAQELGRALGLGGKDRSTGSGAERARVTVTQRIRDAIRRVTESAPRLGHGLDRAVKTGAFCRYDPGPRAPSVDRRG